MEEKTVQENIHTLLEKILKDKFKDVKLSPKSIQNLEEKIWKNLKQSKELNEKIIIEKVKMELKNALVTTIIRNPNSKISLTIMSPWKKIYTESNKEFRLENNLENYQIFVNITILLILNANMKSIASLIKQWYKKEALANQVQKSQKSEKKEKEEQPDFKAKKETLIEQEWQGNKEVLHACIQSLPEEEKEYIKSIQSESDIDNKITYERIVKKIKQNTCCYFMLKMKCQTSLELIDELRRIGINNNFLQRIEKLRAEYFRRIPRLREEIEQEIDKQKEIAEDQYKMLNIFLGNRYDNGEYEVKEILKTALDFLKQNSQKRTNKVSIKITTDIFKGNIQMMNTCLQALDDEMKDYIEHLKGIDKVEENEYYYYTIKKLKEASCLYFLMKWKYKEEEKIKEKLKAALSGNYLEVLKELQTDFFNTNDLSFQYGIESLSPQKIGKEKCDNVRVFLGKKYYNGENPEIIMLSVQNFLKILSQKTTKPKEETKTPSKILIELQKYPELYAFINQNPEVNIPIINHLFLNRKKPKTSHQKSGKTLSQRMSDYELLSLKIALEKLKYLNPGYYKIITAYHGINLNEIHPISKKDKVNYNNAINRLGTLAKRLNLEEERRLLKKSLQNTREDRILSMIKQRRKGKETAIIAKENKLTIDEICRIYADNLLLFGKLIPEVLKEMIQLRDNSIDYLKQSTHFLYLINCNSFKENIKWVELLSNEKETLVRIKISEYLKPQRSDLK